MATATVAARPIVMAHGAEELPSVTVNDYNCELKDDEGFIGDRASKGALRDLIENWRKPLRKLGKDPFGDEDSNDISKKKLDDVLTAGGNPDAAGIVHGAIEEFAQELALVIRRFLKRKHWKEVERIAVGGGFRESRVGELALGRTSVILKAEKIDIDLVPIHNDPDEAGLIGSAHLAPRWIFDAHDAILAVDIGGTNIRAGIVTLAQKKAADLSKASVAKIDLWRHADEDKLKRDEAVEQLAAMIRRLVKTAEKERIKLAPFIGIGCPGIIEADGSIDRGAQNLPGNWESARFKLPEALLAQIPTIGQHDVTIVMHNDAVVQGLSEIPFMTDVQVWGVLTIGTGLGNACFTNRDAVKS
ncbi:MAG: ROK family protein [Xanthobacteraceae bacterium]